MDKKIEELHRRCPCPKDNDSSCEVNAKAEATIEIAGDGVRAALAELFIAGGELELAIKVKCDTECGAMEKITLVGDCDCVAKFKDDDYC